MHKLAGHEPPTNNEAVRTLMRGIRRTIGSAKTQKAPLTADLIQAVLNACPDTLRSKRDRALLALGFAGAFRRSELVALQVADLIEGPDPERTKQLLYNIAVAWLRARDKDLREEECA
jgi:integrase